MICWCMWFGHAFESERWELAGEGGVPLFGSQERTEPKGTQPVQRTKANRVSEESSEESVGSSAQHILQYDTTFLLVSSLVHA